MNTLEERLERSGYSGRLAENERDKRLVENAKLACELSGSELPPELVQFDEAIRKVDTALAGEYESTVRLVDSRNDVELELLQILERMELAAEECEETDPERSEEQLLGHSSHAPTARTGQGADQADQG